METSLKHFSSRLKYSSQFAWLNLPWEQVWKTLTATSDIQKFSFANSASIQLFQCNNFKRIVHFHRWYIYEKIIFFSEIIRKRMILIYRWFMLFFLNLEFTRKAVTSMTSPLVRRSAYKQQEVLMIIKDDKSEFISPKVFCVTLHVLHSSGWVDPLLNQTILSRSSTHRHDHHPNEAPSGLLWVRGRQTEEKLGLRWGRMLEFSLAGKT